MCQKCAWFIAVLIIAHQPLRAQKLEKRKFRAEGLFFTEKFEEARLAYEEILSISPDDKLGKYRVEICSLLTNAPDKSPALLESYARTQGRKDKFYYYWLAHVYGNQGAYKKAIEACDKFFTVNRYKTREIRDEVLALRKLAELRYYYFKQSPQFELNHLSDKINTSHNEFCPVYFDEHKSIMFLSSHKRIDVLSRKEKFHVFESKKEGPHWHSPKMIHHLHSYNEQNTSFSLLHGQEKLFVFSDKEGGQVQSSIYNGHTWSVPTKFEADDVVSEVSSHFFINESENRIIFSAEVKAEEKHLDLYQSVRDETTGQWSIPKSIPKVVNSIADEDFPYLSQDGKTLYFSSKGHDAIGGYDIFKSEWDETTSSWTKPKALGFPINSLQDDIQFSLNDNLVSGLFASNRKGTKGGFDIYSVRELNTVLVEGTINDGSGNSLPGAAIVLMPADTSLQVVKVASDHEGKFKLKANTGNKFQVEVWVDAARVHKDSLDIPMELSPELSLNKNFDLNWKKED